MSQARRQTIWLLSLLLGSSLFCPDRLFGQELALDCSLSVSKITVGDPVEFRVLASYPSGYRLVSLPLEPNFGKLELLEKQAVAESESETGRSSQGIVFRITAFEVGAFETPPLEASFTKEGSSEVESASCDPLAIEVASVLQAGGATDLKDIKLPVDLPSGASYWWLWVLLLGLLGVLAWVLWKRRNEPAEALAQTSEPLLDPFEEAFRALAQLEERQLPQQGETKQYYVELSEIIRRFIERKLRVPALEMTSGQILSRLRASQSKTNSLEQLNRILRECDLVKFAKRIPEFERNTEMLELARNWLEEYRPSSPELPEAPAESEPVR